MTNSKITDPFLSVLRNELEVCSCLRRFVNT